MATAAAAAAAAVVVAEEAVAEGASVASVPISGAHSPGELPEGEGERAGAVGEEKDAAIKGAEAMGDSEEDGEDVFEVEKILDMKTEGVRERAGRGPEGVAAGARHRTLDRVVLPEAVWGAVCERG